MIITLPHKFVWRDYQLKPWDAFFKNGKRHMLLVWHRRAGKTKLAVNIIISAAYERVGDYYYLFPSRGQAKRVLWEGRGDDGKRFVDHFPQELISKVNNSELSITFKNGSKFRLLGTTLNSFEKLRGGNPLGILYDEFAEQDPQVRETMLPVLARNKGWEVFIGTPRGHNHFYDLYEKVKNLDSWFVQHLTIDDTKDGDGNALYSQKEIDELQKSGWSADYIDQELYCSFDASQKGAYFAEYMRISLEQNRIRDFLIDPRMPVYTFWDLGISDSTCIWFVQFYPDKDKMDEIRCINYYENSDKGLNYYINVINEFRDTHDITYAEHYLPHDGAYRQQGSAKSVVDIGKEMGVKFLSQPRVSHKQDAIEHARGMLPKVVFNKSKCQRGLDCLRAYHKSFNSKMGRYEDKPVHDWSSHCSDAFMGIGQFVAEYNPPIEIENFGTSILDEYSESSDYNNISF
tara:strand:- start:4131 stop:5507 length:1377 start_codon:yes stop_codon:yes gene_type:complete